MKVPKRLQTTGYKKRETLPLKGQGGYFEYINKDEYTFLKYFLNNFYKTNINKSLSNKDMVSYSNDLTKEQIEDIINDAKAVISQITKFIEEDRIIAKEVIGILNRCKIRPLNQNISEKKQLSPNDLERKKELLSKEFENSPKYTNLNKICSAFIYLTESELEKVTIFAKANGQINVKDITFIGIKYLFEKAIDNITNNKNIEESKEILKILSKNLYQSYKEQDIDLNKLAYDCEKIIYDHTEILKIFRNFTHEEFKLIPGNWENKLPNLEDLKNIFIQIGENEDYQLFELFYKNINDPILKTNMGIRCLKSIERKYNNVCVLLNNNVSNIVKLFNKEAFNLKCKIQDSSIYRGSFKVNFSENYKDKYQYIIAEENIKKETQQERKIPLAQSTDKENLLYILNKNNIKVDYPKIEDFCHQYYADIKDINIYTARQLAYIANEHLLTGGKKDSIYILNDLLYINKKYKFLDNTKAKQYNDNLIKYGLTTLISLSITKEDKDKLKPYAIETNGTVMSSGFENIDNFSNLLKHIPISEDKTIFLPLLPSKDLLKNGMPIEYLNIYLDMFIDIAKQTNFVKISSEEFQNILIFTKKFDQLPIFKKATIPNIPELFYLARNPTATNLKTIEQIYYSPDLLPLSRKLIKTVRGKMLDTTLNFAKERKNDEVKESQLNLKTNSNKRKYFIENLLVNNNPQNIIFFKNFICTNFPEKFNQKDINFISYIDIIYLFKKLPIMVKNQEIKDSSYILEMLCNIKYDDFFKDIEKTTLLELPKNSYSVLRKYDLANKIIFSLTKDELKLLKEFALQHELPINDNLAPNTNAHNDFKKLNNEALEFLFKIAADNKNIEILDILCKYAKSKSEILSLKNCLYNIINNFIEIYKDNLSDKETFNIAHYLILKYDNIIKDYSLSKLLSATFNTHQINDNNFIYIKNILQSTKRPNNIIKNLSDIIVQNLFTNLENIVLKTNFININKKDLSNILKINNRYRELESILSGSFQTFNLFHLFNAAATLSDKNSIHIIHAFKNNNNIGKYNKIINHIYQQAKQYLQDNNPNFLKEDILSPNILANIDFFETKAENNKPKTAVEKLLSNHSSSCKSNSKQVTLEELMANTGILPSVNYKNPDLLRYPPPLYNAENHFQNKLTEEKNNNPPSRKS